MDTLSAQAIPPQPELRLPSASKTFGQAVSFYRSHWHTILGISIIPFILSVPQLFSEVVPTLLIILFVIAAFVVGFVSRIALFDAVVENGEPQGGVSGAYKVGWHMLIPFLWVSALVTLSTLGGTFLLFVPGIMLSGWLSLSLYVLFAENRRGVSALAGSWHYVRGYWWSVFWRFLFFGLVFLLIGLAIGLLTNGTIIFTAIKSGVKPHASPLAGLINLFFSYLIVAPLGIIYSYLVYRGLKEIKASVPIEQEEQKLKKNLTIFLVIGIIGLIAMLMLAGFLLVKFIPKLTPHNPQQASFRIPASSLTASIGFSPLLDLLPFGK